MDVYKCISYQTTFIVLHVYVYILYIYMYTILFTRIHARVYIFIYQATYVYIHIHMCLHILLYSPVCHLVNDLPQFACEGQEVHTFPPELPLPNSTGEKLLKKTGSTLKLLP